MHQALLKEDVDLGQVELDLAELQVYERTALADLKRVENLPHWEPTGYERHYLPRLRLVGIEDKRHVVLQNTADLHIHSEWSDGDRIDRMIEQAIRAGLHAIAITDHDEIGGAFEARRRVHQYQLPLAVVPGCEVSTRDGHIGALFVMRRFPRGLSAAETVEQIHQAGGIAVAHHPFAPWWIENLLGVKLGCGDLIKEVPFDAIECTNAVPGYGMRYNIAAIETIREQHISIAVTGGSDAHEALFVGKGKTYFGGNEGVVSLRNALLHGFTNGAADYWKTREKFLYYGKLIRAVLHNAQRQIGSVN
jgi:hypothetical protein